MRRLFIILAIFLTVLAITALYLTWRNHNGAKELVLFGNVDVRQVDLGFLVSGRVDTLPFEEGIKVKEGDLIATLDKAPYEDEVQQARARLESSIYDLKIAKLLLDRRKTLVEEGGTSKEEFETAQANYDVAASRVKEQKAALGVANTNLGYTKLYAPNSGTVLTRIREPGSAVKPSDPVCTITLTTPVWIRAFVSEANLGLIHPNMQAEIYTDTPGSPVYKGHIGFISPVAEFTPKNVESTDLRTNLVFRLRIIADNPDEGLRQGMPVTVKLIRDS